MPEVRARARGPVAAAGGSLLPAAALALLTLLLLMSAAPSARAEGTARTPARDAAGPAFDIDGERIPTYDVVLTIRPDGVLRVRETITYDFDRNGEHGIVRRVRYRDRNRLFAIRDVRTSSSTGAPARAKTLHLLHDVQISVGDRHRKVRGRQAYVIEYEVGGAFTPYSGHDELTWDALGTGWDVPIGEAAARVEAPVPLRRATCRAGEPPATVPCLRDRDGPYAIDFTQRGCARTRA
ncbi:DUF2207 domain-containing protein [Actinomadura yumaensis]|uniref:DUF2207 domain-containing protein n=1 Tax=Actinomadura TaxID=1988 RepID=UPI001326C6FC|nr:DUF2207 domain-containing protein [Actinomadura sp. J1-007]MWK36358.1 DUF2207 domain-containing protein [Actinomadura sp. J1-007]